MNITRDLIVSILFAVLVNLCLGATDVNIGQKQVMPSLNKQRASNAFYNSIHFQKMSASRFLPLFTITGVGSWESSRTLITIDGIPYNGYPFGMNSIDLAPVDLITVDTLSVKSRTGILKTGISAGGSIDIIRSTIPDTSQIDIRIFTGSETGDPLIYLFTRPERSHINKNKVGPSFALSFSNHKNKWSYRISGGGFFYFSTGSVNDFTINRYNGELFNRQNRQVKIIGEAVYQIDDHRTIDFYAAGINLFGWEMSPFTSLFNHYTNISSTGRITYNDTSSGISVALARDESFVWTKQLSGTMPGSLRTNEWKLYPGYNFPVSGNINMSVFANIGLINVIDFSDEKPLTQEFLIQNVASVQWGGGFEFEYTTNRLFSSAGLRVDSQYEYDPAVSAEFLVRYGPGEYASMYATLGSSVYFPGYFERYGKFLTFRERTGKPEPDEFTINGNPDLRPERIREVKIGYARANDRIKLSTELFGRWTEGQIIQEVSRTYRPEDTGEIIRSATYVNNGSRFVPGVALQLDIKPISFLRITSDHRYVDNSELYSLPRYKSINSFEFILPLDVVLDVSAIHIGRTFWREFVLKPDDDDYLGKGFDGRIGETTVIDMAVSRRFERFYFANRLEVSVQVQNLLNAPYRRIPVGNFIDRAVFVYVSFGL